jgi:hypothetical protein
MAEHTRKGSQGQPQYQDTAGAWHDSPSGPSDSGSSDSEDTGGGGESSGGAASRSLSAPTGNARTVVGLMGMAVVFSVIGAEINAANGTKSAAGAAFSEPFIIIGGGTIAAVLLTLLSDAGESAQQFAVGLAGLACITALLVNGAPVWRAIDSFLGAKPTGSTGSTAPTTGTTPSGATAPSGTTGQTGATLATAATPAT